MRLRLPENSGNWWVDDVTSCVICDLRTSIEKACEDDEFTGLVTVDDEFEFEVNAFNDDCCDCCCLRNILCVRFI